MRQLIVKLLSKFPSLCYEALGKERSLTDAVAHLYNTIGSKDILHVNEDRQWVLEGKVMDKEVYKLLFTEVKVLEKMLLWRVLEKDILYQANRKMFTESRSIDDLVAGKLWLYTFDCIKTRLDSLKKESGSFNTG